MGDELVSTVGWRSMGAVAAVLSVCMGAVIDQAAFATQVDALARARSRPSIRVLTGGEADSSDGYFVQPSILESTDPTDEVFTTEYFGPILGVHVFDDAEYARVVAQAADIAPYALTGPIIPPARPPLAHPPHALP